MTAVLDAQRTAGNRAVAALLREGGVPQRIAARTFTVQRNPILLAGIVTQRQEAAPAVAKGQAVGKLAIVDNDGVERGIDPGVNLRESPSDTAPILERLPHNHPVFVDKQIGTWYLVIDRDNGRTGYMAADYVNTRLPDPGAKLHRIASGETALQLAHRFYGTSGYAWGADARFYVNVLAFVNREAKRPGIDKPSPDADWDTTKILAGKQIWIPSKEFAQTLRGQVKSGSISYEAWEKVKSAAAAALELLIGAGAFIGGLIVGALESLWDTISGIVKLAWSLIKSILTGSIISDISGFIRSLSKLKAKDLLEAIGDWLEERWNNKNVVKRWYWRGHIIGYAIAEVLMMFFSGGLTTMLKSAAKSAKLVKLIEHLPAVAKVMEKARQVSGGPAAQAIQRTLRAAAEAKPVKAAVKAGEALSEAAQWAVKVLRIPVSMLADLSESSLQLLRRLSRSAVETLSNFGTRAKRYILGCASPCKVNIARIEKELAAYKKAEAGSLAARAGAFTAEHIAAFQRLLFRPLTNGDVSVLHKAWAKVADPADLASLTLGNSRRLFNNHRKRFWKAVQDDSAAKKLFTDAGCKFGKPGSAPFYDLALPEGGTRRIIMSIDHIVERQSDFARALDPSNLRIVFLKENTVMLRLLNQMDPFASKVHVPLGQVGSNL